MYSLNKTDFATSVIQLYEYFQKLNELNSLQAKVKNSKRKAVNISESNISGISYDCNALEGVRDCSSASRFT